VVAQELLVQVEVQVLLAQVEVQEHQEAAGRAVAQDLQEVAELQVCLLSLRKLSV
jgi:hypothetical protein